MTGSGDTELSALLARGGHGERPVLGCAPLYPPLELFHAMGLAPVVLWGLREAIPTLSRADRHLQSYVCSVARRLTEAVLAEPGALDGLYVYNACDTLRNLPEILARNTELPLLRLHVPLASAEQPAAEHLRSGIARLIRQTETTFGVRLERHRFAESVALYRELRRLYLEAEQRVAAGAASFGALQQLALAGALTAPERQIAALRRLLDRPPAGRPPGPGVVLGGILPPPGPVTALIEQAGLTVVANDIALMHRAWAHTPEAADPTDYHVEAHRDHFPCTTLLHTADRRLGAVERLVRRSGARGLIVVAEKFCECETLELPQLTRRLDELGVRTLTLEIPPDGAPPGQTRTRVEAFAELLGGAP